MPSQIIYQETSSSSIPTPGAGAVAGFVNNNGIPQWKKPDGTLVNVAAASSALVALFDHFTPVGSVGTAETDLYSDSIAAATLVNPGDKLFARYGVTLVNSTSTKEVKTYFAGTVIADTGVLTMSAAGYLEIDVLIMLATSTTAVYVVKGVNVGGSSANVVSVGTLTGLNFTVANILKITGQAAGTGAANGDVTALIGSVSYQGA